VQVGISDGAQGFLANYYSSEYKADAATGGQKVFHSTRYASPAGILGESAQTKSLLNGKVLANI
jgi:hypothetical protein